MTIAAFITVAAQLSFLFNFFYSLFAGEKATENPWNATTLEWRSRRRRHSTISPATMPVVYRGPTNSAFPDAAEDFIPQRLEPSRSRRKMLQAHSNRAATMPGKALTERYRA